MNFDKFFDIIFAGAFTIVIVPLAVLVFIHLVKMIIEAII